MYFPVTEKIPFSVSFPGTNPSLTLLLSDPLKRGPPGSYLATHVVLQGGDPWVSAGKLGGTKYICLCKCVDRGVARRNSTRLIFETSRGPVCISTQNSRLIQAPPWNSPLPCPRTRTEALRFWFEPAPRLCAYRSFPGNSHQSTEWLSRSTESILSDRSPHTRQHDRCFSAAQKSRPLVAPF